MNNDSSATVAVGTDASSASRHVEVERKFDVVDTSVTPSFDGRRVIGSVHRCSPVTLDAVYCDTAGMTLPRITLRCGAALAVPMPAGTLSSRPDPRPHGDPHTARHRR